VPIPCITLTIGRNTATITVPTTRASARLGLINLGKEEGSETGGEGFSYALQNHLVCRLFHSRCERRWPRAHGALNSISPPLARLHPHNSSSSTICQVLRHPIWYFSPFHSTFVLFAGVWTNVASPASAHRAAIPSLRHARPQAWPSALQFGRPFLYSDLSET
jgi:hypothetical protein